VPEPRTDAPAPLLAVDWNAVTVTSDAEALALWRSFAITGADWEAKVNEIPSDKPFARPLALAFLRAGNFACPAVVHPCVTQPIEVQPPAPTATLDDPCVRRLVALWAIDQLEPEDLPAATDALHKIAALPPPESQLVAAAIAQFPDTHSADRLATLAIAWQAGQRELVDGAVGSLDEADLITAATRLHIDGAVEVLSPTAHRKVYLAAIADDKIGGGQRKRAMAEIAATDSPHLLPDAKKAFVAAATSADCTVAASAARTLDTDGDHRFVPTPARTPAAMMHQLCVLASWNNTPDAEQDKVDLYTKFIGRDGLEEVKVTYDPSSDTDPDGDGDPHTEHVVGRVAKAQVVLPELEDLVRAMRSCTGQVCSSEDHDFRFTFKPAGGALVLAKLEVDEKPPCITPPAVGP
jgi:hypothetical protein